MLANLVEYSRFFGIKAGVLAFEDPVGHLGSISWLRVLTWQKSLNPCIGAPSSFCYSMWRTLAFDRQP
ncbi:hypothetical protein [Seongchinamella sediminis]|uniref:hypothetical protein n=1 Tax=Seongchinamella sediminis TaxID=2283635 RepID=UPI0013C2F6CC|nr:hypothetical protein [Seongchinamella sediminis]